MSYNPEIVPSAIFSLRANVLVNYALEKGVLISIDPDAHEIEGYNDNRYGVLAAQKALVTKEQNLSSMGLTDFEKFIRQRKTEKGIK